MRDISKGVGAERIWRLKAQDVIAAQRQETQVRATVESTKITLFGAAFRGKRQPPRGS